MALYERQNYSTTSGVQTPNAPIQQTNTVSSTLGFFAEESYKMAKTNYEIGKKEVLNDIVKQAYELNPYDQKAFISQVQKNFRTSIKGLPVAMQQDMFNSVNQMIDAYGKDIEKNIYNKNLNELKTNVIGSYEQASNSYTRTYQMLTDDIFESGITDLSKLSEEDRQARQKTFQENAFSHRKLLEVYKTAQDKAINTLTPDGTKIIKEESKFDKVGLLKSKIYNLSLDDIKAFDKNTFRDRDRFMKTLDLNDSQYTSLDTFINQTIKAKDGEREKIEQTATEYTMGMMAINADPKAMEFAKKKYPDIFTDKFVNAMEKNSKYTANPTLVQDEDLNFLGQLQKLGELSKLQNNGTIESDKMLFENVADTALQLNEYRTKRGSSEDTKKYMDEMLVNLVQNQAFADAVNENIFNENYQLGQILSQQKEEKQGEIKSEVEKYKDSPLAIRLANAKRLKGKSNMRFTEGDIDKSGILELRKHIANEGAKMIIGQALRYNTPEASTEEGRTNIANDIEKVKTFYNRRLIAALYKDKVSESDLFNMQKLLENEKKESNIVINGLVYKFKGFTDNGIILEK